MRAICMKPPGTLASSTASGCGAAPAPAPLARFLAGAGASAISFVRFLVHVCVSALAPLPLAFSAVAELPAELPVGDDDADHGRFYLV